MSIPPFPRGGPARQLAFATFVAAVGALTLLALRLRWPGVNPQSLWLDDEWVGLVVRRMSFADFFQLRPPVPFGFIVVEKLAALLSNDPEWPLQVFPLACSLAQVPVMAALTLAITKRRSVAIVAAALPVACPMSCELAVRVKQYAVDGLIVAALLLAGAPLLHRWRAARAWKFAFGAAIALLFSFPSVFVSAPLLNLALTMHWVRRGFQRRVELPNLAILVAFNLSLVLVWAALLRGQSSQAMKDYWASGYMPTEFGAAVQFLRTNGWSAIRSAVPVSLVPLLALVPLGLLDLALRPQRRGLAILLALIFLELIVASALRLYPLGGGRTDSFAHPVVLLCLACGANLALSLIARCVRSRRGRRRLFEPISELCAVVIALAIPLQFGTPAGYPGSGDAEVIRAARKLIEPSDALIVYPHGTIGVAYYGAWPLRYIPWADYAHNFHVLIERRDTLSLSPRGAYWADPSPVDRELTAFLRTPRSRIVYIAASLVHPTPHKLILKRLKQRGYRVEQSIRAGDCGTFVLVPRRR